MERSRQQRDHRAVGVPYQMCTVAQDRAAKEVGYRLIPILLPGVPDPFDYSKLPPFLTQRTWVDFRKGLDDEGPLRVLVNAIKGKPPGPDGAHGQADAVAHKPPEIQG